MIHIKKTRINYKIFLLTFALFVMSVYSSQNIFASEYEKDLGDSKLRNIARVIRPPDVSKTDLKKIKKIAVLVDSISPLSGQVAGDLLAVKLRDKGFEVVEQPKVSEATVKELNRLERQADEKEGKQQREILNVIKIGKSLGLDAVLMGTLFEGRRQIGFTEEKPMLSVEKIIVSTFYLQILDIRTEKVILAVILEYDKGESFINTVDMMTKIIKEELTS